MAEVAGPAMTTPSSTTRTPSSGPGTSVAFRSGLLAGPVILAAEEGDLAQQLGPQCRVQLAVPRAVHRRLDHGQRLGGSFRELGGERCRRVVELPGRDHLVDETPVQRAVG